ncbi:MAG TPA: translocation/assembly module TamB domain-containing protein [Puia sp.]|nr:translocation/assembly module TamB domain-containing protein [Puia sp.]
MGKRLVRIFLRTLLTIFIILVLVLLLIQTPFVQNFARAKAETYLSRKLNTAVRIGGLRINFLHSVTLKDVYIADRQKDTLLSAGLIDVNLYVLGLLHNNLDIKKVQLGDLTVKIKRELPDTAFNFQFIIDAFVGSPSVTPDTTKSTPMRMALRDLVLDRVRMVYRDTVTGNDMEVYIGHNETKMDELDPTNGRYGVPSIVLNGLQARIYQGKPLAVAVVPKANLAGAPPEKGTVAATGDTAQNMGMHLKLGKIEIGSSNLDYRNTANKLSTTLQLGSLLANVKAVDLDKMAFQLNALQLDSTNVTFDNDSLKHQKSGMDYGHLSIRQLAVHTDDLSYSADSISGHVSKGEFSERSGFRLVRLQTRFFYSGHRTWLRDLILQTPGTLIQRSASIEYVSLANMMKDPSHTKLDIDLANSRVQVKDILTFAPFLSSQPALRHPGDVWSVNARVLGTLDVLTIKTLQFSGIRDMRVDVSGRLVHPMDTKRFQADLDVRNLSGSRAAMLALLPKGSVPNNIDIPATFNLRGKLAGSMDAMQSDLVLNTSSGTVKVKGFARNIRSTSGASYDLVLQTIALNLGAILKDTAQYGAISSVFTVKGRGLDMHTANATLSGRVESATYKKYRYQNFAIDGSVADEHATLTSSIDNTAVHFELNASAELAHKFPALKLDWQIDTLDLHALHLVSDTMQLKGHINADFASTDPDSLQGALKLYNLAFVTGIRHLATDTIELLATRENDIEDIRLRSEMADIDWRGRYRLTETGQALQHVVNQYYRLNGFKDTAFMAQDWTMQVHLRASPLVLGMMPSLKGTDSLGGNIIFNSEKNDLHLDLRTPRVVLGTQRFHNVDVSAATGDGQLNYRVQMSDANGSGFALYQTSMGGALRDNHLTTVLLLKDIKEKDRYRLAGQLDKLEDGLKFTLNPDSLLLNYEQWAVGRDNYFQYDSAGVVIHDFTISHKGDSLSVNSNPPSPNAPIDVRFANFSLGTLSRLANQDSLLIDGTLNGQAQVKNVMSDPVFTSDLVIRQLSYQADTIGNLAIKVNNEKANAFSADISLEGNKNDVKVQGEYYTGEGRMDLKLLLGQLNLASFNGVAKDHVQRMRGYLKGQLALTGTMDKPVVKGDLNFDSARFVPTISGEPLTLSNDRIEFDEDGFNFSKFRLQDSAGNKLTIDGNVFTKDYRAYGFDVSLNADDFRLVNSQPATNNQFYGTLNIDAAVNLEGDMESPKIDGDLRVNKKTNFFFVLPGNDPEVVSRMGVVRFVTANGDTLVDMAALKTQAQKTVKGIDLSMNLQTDSSAIFTMVIDERTGDALTARGRSNLVFGMDKSGKTDLTGTYEVESGSYNLSLQALKRKFDITRGSTITWTGDPLTATIDLNATYTANTPSIDLIANEIAGRSQTDINKFKQKLPFLVTLKMEGDLMKPKITFDITLPTNVLSLWPDVDQKLQQIRTQESELDKQVFALLLLNRFVGEDPLQSEAGGGSTLGNMAWQSASQILTNQLNQLASSLIKGVDINFDLNNQQDYSTGVEQDYTELNVSVSKRLFSDRIQVSVGSNFDVQGNQNPGQSASNIAGDVAVDYKLTKDGRYMVRAYRKNQYEAVIEGQVVETGVSFILTFDYNRFRELFGKTREERLLERTTTKPAKGTPPVKQ